MYTMVTTLSSTEAVSTAVLRTLRAALKQAADEAGVNVTAYYPSEYDYLTAERIADVIALDPLWITAGYEQPTPTRVLHALRKLWDDERVWTWGDGAPAVETRRWSLAPFGAGGE